MLPVAFLFSLTAAGSKPLLKHGPSPPVAERQKNIDTVVILIQTGSFNPTPSVRQ